MERTRPSTTVRRDDPGEFRVGRLKHERVKVPRGDSMMEWAESVMQIHADRKSVLEVRGRKFLNRSRSGEATGGFCKPVIKGGENKLFILLSIYSTVSLSF